MFVVYIFLLEMLEMLRSFKIINYAKPQASEASYSDLILKTFLTQLKISGVSVSVQEKTSPFNVKYFYEVCDLWEIFPTFTKIIISLCLHFSL